MDLEALTGALPAFLVQCVISRDAQQPRRELAVAGEIGEVLVGPNECFLGYIDCVVVAVRDAAHHTVDQRPVTLDQNAVGVVTVVEAAADQLVIGELEIPLLGTVLSSGASHVT
jgi:hypothetical protein